jgi:cell wall-associated NlpC family hydrolase
LLDTALSLVGIPYRAGGDTPGTGFDCSGFVTWVFHQHGVALPRTVQALFEAGEAVAPDGDPGAGDLVFFETEGPGATHVGIALGDGRFVHAPSARGVVRAEPLAGTYWARRYLGARRVVVGAGAVRREPDTPPRGSP